MANKVSLINNLTFGFPVNVARPLYQEYSNRRREIDRIWANPENKYKMLQDYGSTVEALLAISLFYRHVLGHIQGATSFYKSVNANNGNASACSIKVGNMILDNQQQGHYLLAAVIQFSKIQNKYQLSTLFFEYSETVQFLRNCRDLFYQKEYEEDDTI